MSNTEQTVGVVAGAVIGFAATGTPVGALQGAYWGYTISSLLFPGEDGRQLPGLQDKRVSSGDYGYSIPFGYGIGKTVGWLMEGQEIREVEVRSVQGGGFGSKKVTITTYDAYFTGAFMICEGPIVGVSRMWADGRLIFDYRSGVAAQDYTSGTPRVSGGGGFRLRVTLPFDGIKLRFYNGSEDQTPDPKLEQIYGVGNVPAYRGIAYVVVDDFVLNSYGKRIPNITFEVMFAGSESNEFTHVLWNRWASNLGATHNPAPLPIFHSPEHSSVTIVRYVITGFPNGYVLRTFDTVTKALKWEKEFALSPFPSAPVSVDYARGVIWLGAQSAPNVTCVSIATGEIIKSSALPVTPTNAYAMVYSAGTNQVWYAADFNIGVFSAPVLAGEIYKSVVTASAIYPIPYRTQRMEPIPHRRWIMVFFNFAGPYDTFRILSDLGIFVADVTLPPPAASNGLGQCIVSEYHDALFIYSTDTYYKISLADFSITAVYTPTYYTTGGALSLLIVNDADGTFIQRHYRRTSTTSNEIIVFDGDFNILKTYDAPDVFFNLTYPVLVPERDELWGDGPFNDRTLRFCRLGRVASADKPCSEIVSDLATRAGIAPADIDVTPITANVVGYVIDRRMPAKSAADPLRIVGLFDMVMEDGKIRAKVRGSNSVMTVLYDDLVSQPEGKRPYDITHLDASKTAEIIDLVYNDKDRNYERAIARDQRTTVRSSEVSTVVLPLAISPDKARQTAQSLLYSAWSGKDVWKIHGSRKHLRLSPGDAFDFVDEFGTTRRLFCTGKRVSGFNVVDIDAIQDEQSAWTSAVLGASGAAISVPAYTPPPSLMFLDIPILREQDDYQGMYIATDFGQSNISAYLSQDGGISFEFATTLVGLVSGYGAGYSAGFAAWTGGNVFDDGSYLDVRLSGGTLSSITDSQVIVAGKNLCLFGEELLQFGVATLQSSTGGVNVYRLTHLLRGRKGTEFAVSQHTTGDRFVMLDPLPLRYELSGIGANLIWKLVKSEEDLEQNARYTSFACAQIGHRPYSPVYITGTRDGSGNLTIGWTRRARYGSAWGASLSVPLDQDTEAYEIEIMQGATIKRTLSASTPTVAYSVADQTTDFGSAQAAVLVNIYQLSSVFGRGTAGTATI